MLEKTISFYFANANLHLQATTTIMNQPSSTNYALIVQAIDFVQRHFNAAPNMEDVAKKLDLSLADFRRLFRQWAGTTPQAFLERISVAQSREILQHQVPIADAAQEPHMLFEVMSAQEYAQGAKGLSIHYSFGHTPFGKILMASTPKGICHLAFEEDEKKAIQDLIAHFPKANYSAAFDEGHLQAVQFFASPIGENKPIKLHLKGTEFQLKVWAALLKIPKGGLTSYGNIATQINQAKASRAVGTAIGSNPIAYLIPCHRVIQSGGQFGGYRWGALRKSAIIGWEAAQINRGGGD